MNVKTALMHFGSKGLYLSPAFPYFKNQNPLISPVKERC